MNRADAITIIKDLDVDEAKLTEAKETLYDIGYSMQQLNVLRADYGEHTAQNVQKNEAAWVVQATMTDRMVAEYGEKYGDDPIIETAWNNMVNSWNPHAKPSSNVAGDYSIDWTWLKNSHGIRFPYMGLNNY